MTTVTEKNKALEEDEEKEGDSVTKGAKNSLFKDLGLKPELLLAIVDSGFEHPSQVQHECIRKAILGMDVICQAKSGRGKTTAFVLSTLQQIEPVAGQVAALVLCHTRELADRICHEFKRFSTYLPDIKVAVFDGDVNIEIDKDLLKNQCPQIVVGTPGRIRALGMDKDLSLKNVRHFILDECDKILEPMDMRRDLCEIYKMIPRDKQVMMFSATLHKEIRQYCKVLTRNPMEIYLDDEANLTLHGSVQPMEICEDDKANLTPFGFTLHGFVHYYIKLSEADKDRKLSDLLTALDFNQVVILVKSVNKAAELNKLLWECNFSSIWIYSGMSQEERLTWSTELKEKKRKRILVATDLLGGIEFEESFTIINYDMPDSADAYFHSLAKGGRFGNNRLVLNFVSSASDWDVLNQVQERFGVGIKECPDQIDTSTYSQKSVFGRKPTPPPSFYSTLKTVQIKHKGPLDYYGSKYNVSRLHQPNSAFDPGWIVVPGFCGGVVSVPNFNASSPDYDVVKGCATMAIDKYNFEINRFGVLPKSNYKFVKIDTVNYQLVRGLLYYITFQAECPEMGLGTFQAKAHVYRDEMEVKYVMKKS